MNHSTLITSNPALIIIDMQQGMTESRLGARNMPEAEDHIAQLLATWRSLDLPIVHVRHMSRSPDSVFWPGQAGAQIQSRFTPLVNEYVMEKNVTDAFCNSGLERWLHGRGISSLVMVGVATNYSVEASARSAACLGFKLVVVSDACFTFDRVDCNGGLQSAEQIHQMSLSNLQGEYAELMLTADLLLQCQRD
ncbi:cysteine hydrolase family protein [Undibacterium sp. Ren11W]|uniref:cysteine hydrolase family protein n=1 Tax=Undibacterium sp. Ren11W TaxID=3413045 RepID=UPI003BF324F0